MFTKSRRIHGLEPLLIIIFSIAVYLNAINHDFIWDDGKFIIQSQFIQHWENLFRIFTSDYYSLSWREVDVNRPIMVASLILDYSIWQLNPLGYHLTNLLLHAANTLLLLFVLRLLMPNNRGAFLGAILFAVHPIHTEAVNSISFREDILVTFFLLLSFLFFLRGLIHRSVVKDVLSLTFYTLAVLSKEMAIMFPAIVLLYCRMHDKRLPKPLFWGYILLSGVYVAWLQHIWQFSNLTKVAYLPVYDRLYMSMVTIGSYLLLHLLPFNLVADYDTGPFFTSTISNSMAVILVGSIIAWTTYALITKKGIGYFFLGWFFITLLPVMNIIPIHNPVAERYLYLPSIGMIGLAVLILDKGIPIVGAVRMSLIAAIVVSFSITTLARNTVWKDGESLWSDTIRKAPENIRARNNLRDAYYGIGVSEYQKGDHEKALRHFSAAISIDPADARSYNMRGIIYYVKGENGKAIENYNMAIALDRSNADLYNNRGRAYYSKGGYDLSIKDYTLAIALNPKESLYYSNRGDVYVMVGERDAARFDYRKACEMGNEYGCNKLKEVDSLGGG